MFQPYQKDVIPDGIVFECCFLVLFGFDGGGVNLSKGEADGGGDDDVAPSWEEAGPINDVDSDKWESSERQRDIKTKC